MLAWHQYILGLLLLLAGMNHFRKPNLYLKIMPPYIPAHQTIVLLSGIAEMLLGLVLLNPETQSLGAWGIIIMLVLFLPVHVHMLLHTEAAMKLPRWLLILRIPLQFVIIYWAYQYV